MRLALSTVLVLLCAATAAAGTREPTTSRLPAAQADAIALRTRKSKLIVIATAIKVHPKGFADCRIVTLLKGKFQGRGKGAMFRMRFSKVMGNVWPVQGVTALFFLNPAIGGQTAVFDRKTVFELADPKHGMTAPDRDVIATVRLAAAGQYVMSAHRERALLKLPAPSTMLGTMLSASYVAVASIEEVHLSRRHLISARLTCRLESVFKGDIRPGKVEISVPKALVRADDPKIKRPQIKAGPAVLMFIRDKGGELKLISPYRGYFAIESRDKIADVSRELGNLVAKEKALRRHGLVGDPSKRTSIARTLQFWQSSWNANEAENVIACYSRNNKWRKEWDSGLTGKKRISGVIEGFGKGGAASAPRASIYVSLVSVEERKKGSQALATVTINVVTRDQLVERRPAVMTFSFENGMWLILHEGN
jgi:hypothetical protein